MTWSPSSRADPPEPEEFRWPETTWLSLTTESILSNPSFKIPEGSSYLLPSVTSLKSLLKYILRPPWLTSAGNGQILSFSMSSKAETATAMNSTNNGATPEIFVAIPLIFIPLSRQQKSKIAKMVFNIQKKIVAEMKENLRIQSLEISLFIQTSDKYFIINIFTRDSQKTKKDNNNNCDYLFI